MPSCYFTGACDFHQSGVTDGEGGSRFQLAAQADERAYGEGNTHLLNWPGPCRGGGARSIPRNSSVNTLMWILKLKVFMNETPLFKTRPPPSERRTTWRKEWGKAVCVKAFSKVASVTHGRGVSMNVSSNISHLSHIHDCHFKASSLCSMLSFLLLLLH